VYDSTITLQKDLMNEATIRKSISFPRSLEEVIKREAKNDRRSFNNHLVKMLEDIFLSRGVIHLAKKGAK
jgi:hypothetical protein